MRSSSVLFSLLTLFGGSSFAQAPFYDELYDSHGRLRPQYEIIQQSIQYMSNREREQFLVESRKAFQGDNALDATPRILTAEEGFHIQLGVEQRAKALRAFLQDHYSGRKSYLLYDVIPADVLRRILIASSESVYEGVVDPNSIAFMYGPDIIRDADGVWRVIEDNPGFIGGVGDLKLAYDLILKKYPQISPSMVADPMVFYKEVAKAYINEAKKRGGKAILYMEPPYVDNEDQRIKKLFAEQGIETVTPNTKSRLFFTENGVFLNSEKGSEKVGFIFLNGEHADMDNSHPLNRVKIAMEAAESFVKDPKADPETLVKVKNLLAAVDPKTGLPDCEKIFQLLKSIGFIEMEKSPASGLMRAILEGKVGSNYTPGIDFIGDKEFYFYVENMIRFYLKEEPILKNIPSEKFIDEHGRLHEDLFQRILRDKDQYVMKKKDGRGGDGVKVGLKTDLSEVKEMTEVIRNEPDSYISQKFTHLSVLGKNIVDIRWIVAVLPNQIVMGETSWGRGLPIEGDGKVNLSSKGREVTVLVLKDPLPKVYRCEGIFGH